MARDGRARRTRLGRLRGPVINDSDRSPSRCHLEAHRTAASLLKNGALPRCIGRSRGGLTTKLQTVCDDQGRPLLLHLAEGQANDHKTAAAVLDQLPHARFLLADRAYSCAAFRQATTDRGITPCIQPPAKHRGQHATRYDRCAHTFLSAIAFAATFIF
ncbi:transposase [Sphingomonas sp. DT-204]|uniref:transposase n=1 Tax=Sphingomonas sp. DT-204 TaxID=3396166 RepID=UPI003F1C2FC2